MADDPTTASTDAPTDAPAPEPKADEPTDDLGEAGKKAIESERRARRAAEKAAKDLQARLEDIERANLSETERAIAQARDEARAETLAEANHRIIRSEIRAVAAGKLSDPADAVAFIDLSQFQVDADGNVDSDALSSAIDELITAKPYLAASATPRSPGSGDGGARTPNAPRSLAQEIAEAEAAGDWSTAMALKARQLGDPLKL